MAQEHHVNAEWLTEMTFEGDINDHKIMLDGSSQFGGENRGTRPKPLMLLSLAGCTGMDIVSILGKMRVKYEHFSVDVAGELTDGEPQVYKSMHISYIFQGEDLNIDKIKRAVDLSQTKYCGVLSMYRHFATVTFNIQINGETIE